MRKFLQPLLFLMGTTIFAQAPTNGLVAYYGFESNIDSHDAQNNFTARSNTTSTISYNVAKRGNGIYFQGQTGIINTSLSTILSPATNGYSNAPFTLSFWAKESVNPQSTYGSLFELYGGYLLRFQSSYLHSEVYANNNYLSVDYTDVFPNMSNFRHYTIIYDPSTSSAMKLYINGAYKGNINSSGWLNKTTNNFVFGNGMSGSGLHSLKGYQGTIDELFVYNRALTPTEVSNLYNGVNYSIISNTSHSNITGFGAKISYSIIPLTGVTSDCKLYLGTSANNLILHSNGNSGNSGTMTGNIELTGLQGNTTYYYKITSTNSSGTTESEVKSFTTLAVNRPTVTWDISSTPAFNITSTSADIKFNVNPNNGLTTSVLKYGLSYGALTNSVSSTTTIQGGNQTVTETISLTNLQPNTTYYYIAEATNSAGTGQASLNVGGTNYPAVYSFTTSNLATNEVQNELKASIFPNPVKDILNIKIDGKLKLVEIYNFQGQKVISSNQKQINTSSLAAGVYIIQIEDENNKKLTKKIIKQ